MTIPLDHVLPRGLQLPTRIARAKATLPWYPRGSTGARSLFGIAPGGACHAAPVTSGPVGSYPTFSPWPAADSRRFHFCGAFRRVSPPGRYPAPLPCGVRTFLV